MKTVKAVKRFEYAGMTVYPGQVVSIPDLTAEHLKHAGHIVLLNVPENRIEK